MLKLHIFTNIKTNLILNKKRVKNMNKIHFNDDYVYFVDVFCRKMLYLFFDY